MFEGFFVASAVAASGGDPPVFSCVWLCAGAFFLGAVAFAGVSAFGEVCVVSGFVVSALSAAAGAAVETPANTANEAPPQTDEM